ncbi:hypothetical protein ACFWZ3_01745 [Frateuria sp. GZRR35]|uniref:hypothetical protein n=1 Tax=Frateuria sp. GZRR35 TaxID=3351536 RepID=UPI003EDBB903
MKAARVFLLATLAWSMPYVVDGTTIGNTVQEPEASLRIIQSDEGLIEGEKYIAQIVADDGAPDFLLLKTVHGKKSQILRMELVGDLDAYRVRIAGNSFYFRQEIAHHGLFSSTYQFKKINHAFQLIGLETQAMVSCIYSSDPPDAETEPCASMEMWSGTSVNFLTSEADCWLQTFHLDRDDRSQDWVYWQAALKDFKHGARPGKAISRTIALPRSSLTPLDQFDLYSFRNPDTCYFDYKGGFHTSR